MKDMAQGPIQLTQLNYLFSHEAARVVVHCLELDLVTSGDDINEAEQSLNALVRVQIGSCYKSGNWAELARKAPFEYWQKLNTAHQLGRSELLIDEPPLALPVKKQTCPLPVVKYELAACAA